jgi:hypothetical protein
VAGRRDPSLSAQRWFQVPPLQVAHPVRAILHSHENAIGEHSRGDEASPLRGAQVLEPARRVCEVQQFRVSGQQH